MSQPLLSIGMIVKNEERSLEKCLNALAPLRQAIPCELIIADTGSTDNTREIASRYADVIFDFEWVNDFSAARNAVIDKATGEWFLTVDADEYLVPDIKELVDFLKGPESKTKTVASVIQRNYKSTQLNGEYVDFNAVRMMKTETGNRYSGRIHEQFYVDDYKSIYILKNTILDHDGYVEITPGDTKKKEKRNLEILESMLKDEPQNIKYIMQCLESSGNNEEKRAYFSAYGMDVLKKGKNTAKFWSVTGPACARQIALFLYVDKNSEFYSWADWCEKNFKDSEFINIDLQYMKLKKYYSDEDYSGVIKTGKEYTKNLTAYKKGVSAAHVNFVSPLLYTAEIHVTEANIIVASALIKEKKENEAISVLRKTDIRNLQVNSVNLLFEN
ncbi:MAG: glycosyltransferase family 2 protein, partial [Clostridia bacterium]|nr:glycosyltransferase family 2 protein [Clostridia bacterium]